MSNSWNQDIWNNGEHGDSHGPCEHLGSSPQWVFFPPWDEGQSWMKRLQKEKPTRVVWGSPWFVGGIRNLHWFFLSQNETLVLVSDGIMTWHGNLLWTGDGIVPSSCQYLSLDLHSCWVNSCEIPKLIQITSSIFFGLPVYPLYKL